MPVKLKAQELLIEANVRKRMKDELTHRCHAEVFKWPRLKITEVKSKSWTLRRGGEEPKPKFVARPAELLASEVAN